MKELVGHKILSSDESGTLLVTLFEGHIYLVEIEPRDCGLCVEVNKVKPYSELLL